MFNEFFAQGDSFSITVKKNTSNPVVSRMNEETALAKVKKLKLKIKEINPGKEKTEIVFFKQDDAEIAAAAIGSQVSDNVSIFYMNESELSKELKSSDAEKQKEAERDEVFQDKRKVCKSGEIDQADCDDEIRKKSEIGEPPVEEPTEPTEPTEPEEPEQTDDPEDDETAPKPKKVLKENFDSNFNISFYSLFTK